MPAPPVSWGDIVLRVPRDQFIVTYRHPFLFGSNQLVRPVRPQRAQLIESTGTMRSDDAVAAAPLAYAITKVQPASPDLITVGRTHDNDVVIEDTSVSKLHAFFRALPDGDYELGDAGSKNGTLVNSVRLEPKGPTVRLRPGDQITVAELELELLEPAVFWDRLVAALDQWG